MRIRGFSAVLYKECITILRDPMTLFFMLFPPLVEMIAFGFALDNDVQNMALLVLDEDRTMESRRLVEDLEHTRAFRKVGWAGSLDELASRMRAGEAYAGAHIPPGFTRDLRAGRNAQVQLLVDGSSSTIAVSALNSAVAVGLKRSLGVLMAETGRRELPVEIRPQVLYNPAMKSPNFFVPGVIGIVLQIATTFATALSVVREKERGTIEQLMVSPVSPWGLMLGKLTPFFVVGMVMAAVLFGIMCWVFGVPITGSVLALMGATAVYNFCLLSLGLLISGKAENAMQALQMSMTLILPSVFFSGFIFPRETMPWIFYALGAMLPATYYIQIERAVILRGAELAEYGLDLTILCAMALVLFVACSARFHRRVG